MANPPQSPARRAAAALLEAVLVRHRSLEEALDALPTDGKPHKVRGKGEARPGAAVSPRDKAAAHRIAAAVLRRAGSLDAVLEPFLRKEPPETVRNALRIGAAELLLLGTPAHAAVGSAVDLVPAPFAGLVNAVLRKVAEAGPAALEGLDAERRDTPGWLWTAWHNAYGPAVRAIAAAHRIEAPLDLSLKPGADGARGRRDAADRHRALPGRHAGDRAGRLRRGRILGAGRRRRLAGAAAGGAAGRAGRRPLRRAGRQDRAARRRRCAQSRRWSATRSGRRGCGRTWPGCSLPAEVVVADAVQWDAGGAPFDAVLLDAPCSATGTIRRHPGRAS